MGAGRAYSRGYHYDVLFICRAVSPAERLLSLSWLLLLGQSLQTDRRNLNAETARPAPQTAKHAALT